MASRPLYALLALSFVAAAAASRSPGSGFFSALQLPTQASLGATRERLTSGDKAGERGTDSAEGGTKWALLIAGSNGYWNYRHQADICHAYQLLKKDGLKDENIVVFMYDDIAYDPENPHPGTLINHPEGSDVYAGVPKDYTGEEVTVSNFLAALLGDASAINGGSGKVIASGPKDTVFVFYSDHGGPGILGMPTYPFLLADDINKTLKKKHANGGFKELVFYLEACESGSIFQGLLPKDIEVYAVSAANAEESSWGTYCPGMDPPPPEEYDTCLGDLFSVAWMEDSQSRNLHKETLLQQYKLVKTRTAPSAKSFAGSHVMQYGNKTIDEDEVAVFLGSDPANDDKPGVVPPSGFGTWVTGLLRQLTWGVQVSFAVDGAGRASWRRGVDQRDADLVHFRSKYQRAADPAKKEAALGKYKQVLAQRAELDLQMETFAGALANALPAFVTLAQERGPGAPLVDDWQCLRHAIRAYEAACGPLTQYGMKYTRVFASLCNSSPLNAADLASAVARMTCGEARVYRGPFSV